MYLFKYSFLRSWFQWLLFIHSLYFNLLVFFIQIDSVNSLVFFIHSNNLFTYFFHSFNSFNSPVCSLIQFTRLFIYSIHSLIRLLNQFFHSNHLLKSKIHLKLSSLPLQEKAFYEPLKNIQRASPKKHLQKIYIYKSCKLARYANERYTYYKRLFINIDAQIYMHYIQRNIISILIYTYIENVC